MEACLALFVNAFLAATLLPLGSELLFLGLLGAGHAPLTLWAWASAGNVLGGVANWMLGYHLLRFQGRRWFPFRPGDLGRAQRWFDRYGSWSLLLAWAPVVGDPLTFVAGALRLPFGRFLLLTGIGKAARYAVLAGMAGGLDGLWP